MTKREEFTAWISAKVGSAYVWGAEGHRVCEDGSVFLGGKKVSPDYKKWIEERETSAENAARCARFIENKLTGGAASIACYDCSGLIMAYIRGVKAYTERDLSANGLYGIIKEKAKDSLEAGDLVFRHNGSKATHVGVYVGGGYAVDARGRDAGVIRQRLDEGGWNRFGALSVMDSESNEADDSLKPCFSLCTGKSVYVRSGAGVAYPVLGVAHMGDKLLALPESAGWHRVAVCCKGRLLTGYMSAKYVEGE